MSVRSGTATGEEFDVLHEGVAPWLKRSLADWIHSELDLDRASPSERRAEEIVRRLRLRLEVEPGGSTCAALVDLVRGADERSLDVIDATLNLCDQRTPGRRLEKVLVEAGSAWAVGIDGDDRQCLQRRVDPEVVNQYVAVVAERRRAATKLQAAWAAAYGRDPSFPDAVIFAVEAVAAASPGTVETQSSPTQVLAELAATGSLVGASDNDALGQNLQLLLHHHERRRTAGRAQAEITLHIAITLVHWLQAGLVSIRSSGETAVADRPVARGRR